MQVQQIMSTSVEYVPTDTTLAQAAKYMRDLDTGFLPIGDSPQGSNYRQRHHCSWRCSRQES